MDEVCASCGMSGVREARCPRCGVPMARGTSRPPPIAAPPKPTAAPSWAWLSSARPPPTPLELAAVPAALALGFLVQATGAGRFLVSASAQMEMHELGHATALWLAGRAAVPLPMFTFGSADRSVLAFLLVGAVLALGARAALRERLPALFGTCALLGVALLLGTLTLADERLDAWVKFAGPGGELWLSALVLAAFHEPMPAAWRWPRARWFFLLWAALALTAATRRWWQGEIPWGSFWGGDGDMDVLRDSYDWSEARILHTYRCVCGASLAAVLGAVLWRGRALLAARLTG